MTQYEWICIRCGATTYTRSDVAPTGWCSFSGNLHCPRCASKMADKREAEQQRRNNYVVKEEWSDKILAMVPMQLILLGAMTYFLKSFSEKMSLFTISGFVMSLVFFVINLYLVIKPFKKMSNALAYFLITIISVFELVGGPVILSLCF